MRLIIGLATVSVSVSGFAAFASADVNYSNATTDLTVRGGAANNGLNSFDGYFRLVDKVVDPDEEPTWSMDPVLIAPTGQVFVLSNGLLGDPVDVAGTAVSTATVASGLVNVTASTQLDARFARSTFDITSTQGSLAGYKFLFYAESDLFGADDIATFNGAVADGSLRMFQYDNSASDFFVQMQPGGTLANATLARFGSGLYTGFGAALEAGDLSVLSTNGSNFVTNGDLGLVLQWDLGSAATAAVSVDYGVSTTAPEPTTLSALAIAGLALGRRSRAVR